MVIAAQSLSGRAHLSFQWQRVGGASERSGCYRVIIQVGRRGGLAVIPPEPFPEVNGEQAVDDRVQAGVDEPKDEQDVGQ